MNPLYRRELELLYLRMFSPMFEYARSTLPNDALAEEAVQTAFRIACQKPEALFASPNPEGWLINTLKNVIRNTERSRSASMRMLYLYAAAHTGELTASPEPVNLELMYHDLADSEEYILLKELILDGLSYLELAQKRNISIGTCRKRVQRAKEKLKKKIQL